MQKRLVLRPEVPGDIREIANYYAGYGVISAEKFGEIVFARFEALMAMPYQGSPKFYKSSRLKGIRFSSVRGFRKILIFYWLIDGGIEVLAVLHGARNIQTLLKRRLRNPP